MSSPTNVWCLKSIVYKRVKLSSLSPMGVLITFELYVIHRKQTRLMPIYLWVRTEQENTSIYFMGTEASVWGEQWHVLFWKQGKKTIENENIICRSTVFLKLLIKLISAQKIHQIKISSKSKPIYSLKRFISLKHSYKMNLYCFLLHLEVDTKSSEHDKWFKCFRLLTQTPVLLWCQCQIKRFCSKNHFV